MIRFGFILLALLATLSPLAPTASASAPRWLDSVDEAVATARESDRRILVDFYADWCGWCKRLDQVVFSDPAFHRYAERFVLLRVDVEDGGEGTRLYDRFGAASLPTTMILDHRLAKIGEVAGFSPVEPFLAKLDRELERARQLDQAFAETVDSDDPIRLQALAEELHSRRDGARAERLYAQLLADDATPASEVVWFRYLRADALRLAGEFASATRQAAEAQTSAEALDDRDLLERIDLLRFRIARDRGQCAFAIEALQAFLDNHPGSRLTAYAEHELDTLRREPAAECT
jgi:thioredoxin-like negative regulator of GroEL